MTWLAKLIYFKLLGWKIVGNTTFSKDTVKKAVIIAVPHTSWHDFHIGILLRKVIGVKTNFMASWYDELLAYKSLWLLTIPLLTNSSSQFTKSLLAMDCNSISEKISSSGEKESSALVDLTASLRNCANSSPL